MTVKEYIKKQKSPQKGMVQSQYLLGKGHAILTLLLVISMIVVFGIVFAFLSARMDMFISLIVLGLVLVLVFLVTENNLRISLSYFHSIRLSNSKVYLKNLITRKSITIPVSEIRNIEIGKDVQSTNRPLGRFSIPVLKINATGNVFLVVFSSDKRKEAVEVVLLLEDIINNK